MNNPKLADDLDPSCESTPENEYSVPNSQTIPVKDTSTSPKGATSAYQAVSPPFCNSIPQNQSFAPNSKTVPVENTSTPPKGATSAYQAVSPSSCNNIPQNKSSMPNFDPTHARNTQTPPKTATNASCIPQRPPFNTTRQDVWLSVACLILGYLFISWLLILERGYKTAVFTVLFAGVTLLYSTQKGKKTPPRESWFWFAAMLCSGLSFCFWTHSFFDDFQFLFLLVTAAYWSLSVNGCLAENHTGSFLAADLGRALFTIPFGNFNCQAIMMKQHWKQSQRKKKNIGAVLLGLGLCIPVLFVILPWLTSADSSFKTMVKLFFGWIGWDLITCILQFCVGIPVSFYLFGLLAGAKHRRGTDCDLVKWKKELDKFRRVPSLTVCTFLTVICVVYFLFILCQAGELFAGLQHIRPENLTYSEYAKQGFFELCQVVGFNLILLLLCHSLCLAESKWLKRLYGTLSILTLLLIATALGRMALYMQVYGLSQKRLLTSYFMIFLAVIFLLALLFQIRKFLIMRVIAFVGAAMFSLLCLVNVDGLIAEYNLSRYQNGTLPSLNVSFLQQCEPAGIAPALKIYFQLPEGQFKSDLKEYLQEVVHYSDWSEQNFQAHSIKKALEELHNNATSTD